MASAVGNCVSAFLTVSLAALPLLAGDSRVPERFEIRVPGVANPAYYHAMRPRNFGPARKYPLLVVIPGSHNPDGAPDENEGKRRVSFWAYQGTEDLFVISVWYSRDIDAVPYYKKQNAAAATDAMLRDALERLPSETHFHGCFSHKTHRARYHRRYQNRSQPRIEERGGSWEKR